MPRSPGSIEAAMRCTLVWANNASIIAPAASLAYPLPWCAGARVKPTRQRTVRHEIDRKITDDLARVLDRNLHPTTRGQIVEVGLASNICWHRQL